MIFKIDIALLALNLIAACMLAAAFPGHPDAAKPEVKPMHRVESYSAGHDKFMVWTSEMIEKQGRSKHVRFPPKPSTVAGR